MLYKIFMMPGGVGIMSPAQELLDNREILSAPPKLWSVEDGVDMDFGEFSFFLPRDVLDHLIKTSPLLYFYEDADNALLNYVGKIELQRDQLLELRGALIYLESVGDGEGFLCLDSETGLMAEA